MAVIEQSHKMANKFPSSTKFSFKNNSKFKTDRVNGEEAEKEEDGWVSIQEDLNKILVEMYLPDADHGIGKAVPQNKQPNAPSKSSNSSSSFTPLSISIPPPVVGCPSAPRNKVRYLQSKVKKDTRNEKIYSQATQQQVFGKASGFVYQLKLCRNCNSSENMVSVLKKTFFKLEFILFNFFFSEMTLVSS